MGTSRPLLLLALLLFVWPSTALASRRYEPSLPLAQTPEATATAVLQAFRRQGTTALRGLAGSDDPDPWLVADELIRGREGDAADAYAKAAQRTATERLPEYVAHQRGQDHEEATRRALAAMEAAARAQNPQAALAASDGLEAAPVSVPRIRIHYHRGLALRAVRRHRESADSFRRAGEAAAELGWLRGAVEAHVEAAQSARLRGDFSSALASLRAAFALSETLDDRALVADVLGRLGVVLESSGAYAKALSFHERHLSMSEDLGDRAGEARALGNIGNAHYRLGDYPKALSLLERGLALMAEIEDRAGIAAALANIGNVHLALRDYRKALSFYHQSLSLSEALGNRRQLAVTLGNIGVVNRFLGDYRKALTFLERALALREKLGDRFLVAAALGNIGLIHGALGDSRKALFFHHRALTLSEETGHRAYAATALGNLGAAHFRRGDPAKALSFHEQALATTKELFDRAGVARALGNVGRTHFFLGDYAKALRYYERALALKEELGHRAGAAHTLGCIGLVYDALGDPAQALAIYERALTLCKDLADRRGVAQTLWKIGLAHHQLGDFREALAFHEGSLAISEELDDRAAVAQVLGHIGHVYFQLGDYSTALARYEALLARSEAREDKVGVLVAVANIGLVHHALGDDRKALSFLGRAVREARRLRARDHLVLSLMHRAKVFLASGQTGRALSTAQRGLSEAEVLLGGLGEEEGASARARFADLYAVGVLAAAWLEEPAEILTFLESGRAGALLETLGGRQALRWTDLPEELRSLELEARDAEHRARREYEEALGSRRRREIWAKRTALDEATERIREVSARIQREAKKQAGLLYPRAATLEEIQGWLEDDEALVLYGLCLGKAGALVLTPDGERIVTLGRVAEIRAACEALCLEDREAQPAAALEALRGLLVEPLDLPESVRTVLVSPEGPLSYVPFGALFDVPVACTPSGTTHVLLMSEEQNSGKRILALGDPDYGVAPEPGAVAIYQGGSDLVPLPGTREEATAIGDVVLLGADANETKLRETLPKEKRWRAVHLACHGLVDPERPTLSSLALTRSGEEDGFLTALEVLRMEIPADLAVLSACETAKGKIVNGEGIVGLTRVFMYAGAPRVLCSLWKVDDEATRTLMTKFYELWNPAEGEGLGAAQALREAQAFVRAHEKWKHPYHWAAWVLWGLPN